MDPLYNYLNWTEQNKIKKKHSLGNEGQMKWNTEQMHWPDENVKKILIFSYVCTTNVYLSTKTLSIALYT